MSSTDQYAEAYREEAGELLGELETTLLELEESPADSELVARAFRAMHTIKGSGAMFGFDEIASFTHELETVFDKVRNGQLAVTAELVGVALRGKDLIRSMLDGVGTVTAGEKDAVVAALKQLLPGARPEAPPVAPVPPVPSPPAATAEPAAPPPAAAPEPALARTYRICFRPNADVFQDGSNPEGLIEELTGLGPCTVVAHPATTPPSDRCDPGVQCTGWDVILTTDRGLNAIRDVFIFVEGRCQLRIDVVDDGQSLEPGYKKLGEILVERGDVNPEDLQAALASQRRIGDVLEDQGLVAPAAVKAAALEQKIVREERTKRQAAAAQAEAASSIRVAAEKLDILVDLVGELVIAQARLAQMAGRREDPDLLSISEEIERLTADLRDNTLNIRMLPIGTTFSKFKRLVRDLSGGLGKEIELVTEGAETELDKTVIERLGDPLVHLIRNSCDHGIESPEARRAADKPAKGTVRLSAYQGGPNVFIEIQDDGAGLDAAAIRAKAQDKGLVTADAKLSDKELFGLIFLAGFSTAAEVSNLSGRGVGMDVVKRSIDALRGTVEVESTRGVGTTIRIKLPLTLAIIDGLLVGVGGDGYVLPLSLVEECVELTADDVAKSHGRRLAPVRGELVPYLRLREWFGVEGERPEIEQIVIANVEGNRFGFVVDGVVGQHQTVIKTLGRMYRETKGLSGATILGDGAVALILDVPALIRGAAEAEGTH